MLPLFPADQKILLQIQSPLGCSQGFTHLWPPVLIDIHGAVQGGHKVAHGVLALLQV